MRLQLNNVFENQTILKVDYYCYYDYYCHYYYYYYYYYYYARLLAANT